MRLRCANSISTFLRSRREVRRAPAFKGKVDSLCSPFSLVVHDPESTFELASAPSQLLSGADRSAFRKLEASAPSAEFSGCSYLWAFTSASSFSSFLTCSCSVDRRELSRPDVDKCHVVGGRIKRIGRSPATMSR